MRRLGIIIVLCGLWSARYAAVSQPLVRPLVDVHSPLRTVFPSDLFTVADAAQNTGRRVNLPLPDCTVMKSDCEDLAVLNQLDGFSMQPRIWVPFNGDIDPASVNSQTTFLVKLSDALTGVVATPAVIGINQMVWDPETRTLSVRSDSGLDQHSRYAFVVTTGVRDSSGRAIGGVGATAADEAYRTTLATAAQIVRKLMPASTDIAAMTVFTTQSFSHVIERIRDAVQRAPAPTLDFAVGPSGARAVFTLSDIQSIANNADYGIKAPANVPPFGPLPALRVIPGAIGRLAFGKFTAIDFTTRGSGHIAPIPSRTGVLHTTGNVNVAFNLVLPSGAPPAQGWPVAMCGHGSSVAKNYCFTTAAVPASQGIAVISVNAMSHGAGSKTTMTVARADGTSMEFAAPGLGYDQDGDGSIELFEPRGAARPYAIMETAGPTLQTASFYLQLVRAIQQGVDVDGDGRRDLDPSRIYYFGHSLGGMYGMYAFAYEPAIRAAVFVVPAGDNTDNRRFSPGFRNVMAQRLAARIPSLINAPGLTAVDGVATPPPHFNENLPLRNEPTLINRVAGAIDIQRFADRARWAHQIASTVAIAPLLRRSPVAGVPARPMLIQFARSDPASTNPDTSELIRAGGLEDRTAFYRHDLNFGNDGVPANAHLYLGSVAAPASYSRIALAAQRQIAEFFKSDGARVIHPEPAEFWEVPIKTLPEDLFLLPRPR